MFVQQPTDRLTKTREIHCAITGVKHLLPTVLSGAEERGVDGPSLDGSYFSRPQPVSFLCFNLSSSHIACSAYRVLDIDVARAHNENRAGEAAEMFRPVDVESFRSQQCR